MIEYCLRLHEVIDYDFKTFSLSITEGRRGIVVTPNTRLHSILFFISIQAVVI